MPERTGTVRVDAHHHVWDLSVRDQPWTLGRHGLHRSWTFDELRPKLQAAGIGATVVVQTIPVPEETPELLALAAIVPEIAGVIGWVDLTAPDVADRLAELAQSSGGDRLVGIRHQVQDEADPDWLGQPAVLRGLAAVAKAGLSYDILVLPHQLPAAIAAARAVPDLRFVLDHAAKPAIGSGALAPWDALLAELAAEPNVAAKVSGLITEAGPQWTADKIAPYGTHLVDCFGPDRLLVGSDWPVCTEWADYAGVLAVATGLLAGLDDTEQQLALGGTACGWYQLARVGG